MCPQPGGRDQNEQGVPKLQIGQSTVQLVGSTLGSSLSDIFRVLLRKKNTPISTASIPRFIPIRGWIAMDDPGPPKTKKP
jgi:hypothetical protein